jgi:proline iminopeptidase
MFKQHFFIRSILLMSSSSYRQQENNANQENKNSISVNNLLCWQNITAILFIAIILVPLLSNEVKAQGNTEARLTKGEHFANVNHIKLHYYVGAGKGPVMLVASPGWGIYVNYLMPLGIFEKDFKVVYFDTRHTGKSTGPSDPMQYTDNHFVTDIDSLREYLGQSKIYLAGHSASGYMVLSYALKHGDKLKGLVTIDGIAAQDSLRQTEMARRVKQKQSEPFYKAHPELYQAAYEELYRKEPSNKSLAESIGALGPFYLHDPSRTAALLSGIQFNDSVNHYVDKSGFLSRNLLPDLHQINVPTLIIFGDDDFICDHISQATRIHKEIKSSELAIIHNSGHLPWKEQPAAFDKACSEWIRKQLKK